MSLNSPSLILESSWFKLAAWTWTSTSSSRTSGSGISPRRTALVRLYRSTTNAFMALGHAMGSLSCCSAPPQLERLLGASARVRHKRRQLRRGILDLVLTNYLPPEETQRAGDFDTEANGCLSTGRRVLVPGAHCGAKQMCGIHQNVRPHLVERQLNLWSAPRLQ